MNKSSLNKLAILLGILAFILAITSIGFRSYRGHSFDHFHAIFVLALLAFLVSLAGRKQ